MKTFSRSTLATAMLRSFVFDASSLLAAEMDTSEFDIERTLIPEGEVRYRIGKPKINSGEKDGRPWAQLTLPLECVDTDILKELAVEKIGTRTQFFLDLDDAGKLARGTNLNVNLGKAFSAAGLHGEECNILALEGRIVIGNTKQKRSDNGAEYNEVVALAADDA